MKKEQSEYHNEYYKKEKSRKKPIIFLIFLSTIMLILFFTFSDKIDMSIIPQTMGNTIKIPNAENYIPIKLTTNIPNINFKLENSIIHITTPLNQNFILDEKIISLNKPSSTLILENFSGILEIDEDKIHSINGKVSRVTINGVPIENNNNQKMNIDTSSEIKYESIEFKTETYLKEASFLASGIINIDGNNINLNEDYLELNNLLGIFSITRKQLSFEGKTNKINIDSLNKKISILK